MTPNGVALFLLPSSTKAHLDNDDGRLEWEIEFVSGGMEKEFDMDAHTAAVLEMDIDRAD